MSKLFEIKLQTNYVEIFFLMAFGYDQALLRITYRFREECSPEYYLNHRACI